MIIVGIGWELNSKSVRETRQERFCFRTCNLACDWWCWLGFKSRPNLRLSRGSSQIWARFEYHDGYRESDPITLFWQTKEGKQGLSNERPGYQRPQSVMLQLQSLTCFAAVFQIHHLHTKLWGCHLSSTVRTRHPKLWCMHRVVNVSWHASCVGSVEQWSVLTPLMTDPWPLSPLSSSRINQDQVSQTNRKRPWVVAGSSRGSGASWWWLSLGWL